MAPGSVVLVTGGSGFIGSHVVDALLAAGHRVRIYDARPSAQHPELLVMADLDDLDALTEAARGCDAVIHLAAEADVNEVLADPVDAERRNAGGTLHLLEAARRADLRRVIYASTIWAYSDTEAADVYDESLALRPPAHLYTSTKVAGEYYCHAYSELYGIEYTVLRFGIPYGPRARPAAVIPVFVKRALAGEPLTIAGDGLQSRTFVYVEDLADGVVRALAPIAVNRTYNLVSSEEVTIRAIAESVRAIVGDVEIQYVPGRTGDFAGAPVSGERAAAELGWRATTPFAEGVRRYVAWHCAAVAAAESAVATAEVSRAFGAFEYGRRAVLALGWALATAAMILGVASLTPVQEGIDADGVFGSALILLLPVVLAGGFRWDDAGARSLRVGLWTGAIGCLALALLPWPPLISHFGHGHAILLTLLATAAAASTRLVDQRPLLPAWLGLSGE
jgi:UDP-glucose 4-epimerase